MSGFLGSGGVSPVPGSAQGSYPQYQGIYYGVVSNNADPNNQNRCLLRVPMLLGSAVTTWAISLTPQQAKPAVGTLVAALFMGGDLDYPAYYVINPQLPVETSAGNIKPIGTASSAGTSVKYAAADHVHGNISTLASDMQADGTAAAGSSGRVADAQHAHPGGNYLPAGSGGFLQIVSSEVTGGDSEAYIELESLDYAGQTTIILGAQRIILDGFAISSQATPSIISVPHNPNDPSYGGAGGTTWVSGERAALDGQIDNINANFSAIVSALQAAGIWH